MKLIIAIAFIAVGCAAAQAGDRMIFTPNGKVHSINGRLELPSLEPGGGGSIARCASGYITHDPSCGATNVRGRVRKVR